MKRKDFDRYAARYEELLHQSTGISGFAPTQFAQRKIDEVCGVLSSGLREKNPLRFLDYGCGIGMYEPFIARSLPNASVYAADASAEAVSEAIKAHRDIPGVTFAVSDGMTIPFEGAFDVIFLANVLHHVPQEKRLGLLGQFHEKLAGNGMLFIFEHNPYNPFTRMIVRSCVFDRDAALIPSSALKALLETAGFRQHKRRFIHFFPGFLRFLVPFEQWLRAVPLGAQYYIAAIRSD